MVSQSSDLALKIRNSLSDSFPVANVKNANFSVLKDTKHPSVMIEFGFLTNETDRDLLGTENGQDLIAKTIFQALKK